MLNYLTFVRTEKQLLSFALLFAFFSSVGQTFFISLFVPDFLTAFDLSNAAFGTLYSLATLTGAFMLPWIGQWIDRIPLERYALMVSLGLLAAALLMIFSWHIYMLFAALILVRLTGQGLCSHTAQASMARYYNHQQRGKALSVSALGYPLGEAIFPIVITSLLAWMHWRTIWSLIALLLFLVFIPLSQLLIRRNERILIAKSEKPVKVPVRKNYVEILTDRRTWFLLLAVLIPPFWVTGLFLYQIAAAESLGWSVGVIASAFTAFALARIVSGLIAGPLTDRFSAQSIFPFYLLPMLAGLLIGYYFPQNWAAFLYLGLIGVTMGLGSTVKSALWAELFGTKIIGTVQSLFSTIMVFSTAASPFLVGWMLDAGYGMKTVLLTALITTVLSILLSARIHPVFNRAASI
ncbi:MAG: MFS transporter [Balneolaceae bacterium]|nr:MAG: MFS transporter [Balneolaceae bacterium]